MTLKGGHRFREPVGYPRQGVKAVLLDVTIPVFVTCAHPVFVRSGCDQTLAGQSEGGAWFPPGDKMPGQTRCCCWLQLDRARAAGNRPAPPVYQEVQPGSFEAERPPSSLWSAIVATGVANRMEADRLLRLILFFDRADSFGERYPRYSRLSEEHILPYLDRPERFYGPDGRIDPLFATHVAQLRNMGRSAQAMSAHARQLSRSWSYA